MQCCVSKLRFSSFAGAVARHSIVEEGVIAYGKHVQKEGEAEVPQKKLDKFLKVQNGADIRGVVLDGVSQLCVLLHVVCRCTCQRTGTRSRQNQRFVVAAFTHLYMLHPWRTVLLVCRRGGRACVFDSVGCVLHCPWICHMALKEA